MMEQRETLLRKWAELAPGECEVRPDPASETFHEVITFTARNRALYITESPYFEAVLLSALIDAVRARKWDCSIDDRSIGNKQPACYAVVTIPPWSQEAGEAEEPCDALLSAYIQALEAVIVVEEKAL